MIDRESVCCARICKLPNFSQAPASPRLVDPLIRVERISRQIGKTIAYKNLPEADYAAASSAPPEGFAQAIRWVGYRRLEGGCSTMDASCLS